MTFQKVRYEFAGFEPGAGMRNFIASVADGLSALAPSDSTVRVVLSKSAEVIRASCRIASRAGIFAAEAIADNPITAAQNIERKIRQQLDEWKKHRFAHKAV